MATKTSENSTFDPSAIFASLSEGFNPGEAAEKIIETVKQGNQAALDSVKSVIEGVAKLAPSTSPASSLPFVADAQKNALAGIEFFAKLYAAQTEFATNLVKVLVPSA